MEIDVQSGEIAFLAAAVGAISLFGGVLGWASFMEWRAAKRRQARSSQSEQQNATTDTSVRRAF